VTQGKWEGLAVEMQKSGQNYFVLMSEGEARLLPREEMQKPSPPDQTQSPSESSPQ
jgi:hypothetical protein